jgi:hypothetical protein
MSTTPRLRAFAERLVAIPSLSPDVAGESACARAWVAMLPRLIARLVRDTLSE